MDWMADISNLIMLVGAPLLLGAAIFYAAITTMRRRRDRRAQAATERATAALYKADEQLRQNREGS